jgi:hypothetical protein
MIKKDVPSDVSSETPAPSSMQEGVRYAWQQVVRRRSFLKGVGMAGATLPAAALLTTRSKAATTGLAPATWPSCDFSRRPN